MAKADKSDTPTDAEKAVDAKISGDVVDAEIIAETSVEETDEATAPDNQDADDQDDVLVTTEDVTSSEGATEDSRVTETSAPDEEVAEEVQETSAIDKAPVKKTGFVQVALGGAVAAALGFGLSQYVGPLFVEKDPALVELEAVVAAQSQQIDALLADQSEIQAALAAAQESALSTTSYLEGLTGAMAAVNGRIDDAAGALATLDGRLAALEKNPISQNLPSAAIEAYEREVEELKAAVAEQRAEAASMEENARMTAQQALARAALSRVLSALESGAPYRVALTDFSAATGAVTPGVLDVHADEGVTPLASLQSSFPDVARKALAVARSGADTDGNRLTSFFKAQLGARSVTPQEGDSADAVLSRAEAALKAGRVTDALAELASLPDPAKAEFAAWIAEASARQEALAAGEALSQQLNAN